MGRCEHRLAVQSSSPAQTSRRSTNAVLENNALGRKKHYRLRHHSVDMTKETSKPKPPQPIVIQSSAVLPVKESGPVPSDKSASAPPANGTSDGLGEAIERYETLKSQTDPGTGLSFLAVVFLLGGPIIAFTMLGSTSDLEEAFNFCCGGIVIGSVLGLISATQTHAHQKEVKRAFDAVKAEINMTKPQETSSVLTIALALVGGGFLLAQAGSMGEQSEVLLGIGVILFILGLLMSAVWLANNTSGKKKETEKRILAAAKSKLQYSEEE